MDLFRSFGMVLISMQRLSAYLPVILWMAVIFTASTDIGSSDRTGRVIRPLLQWLNPNVSEETVKLVQAVVRKTGHVSEYAVLAMLVWRARRLTRSVEPWKWRQFVIVVGICAAYASSDEFHQLFVASRQSSVLDVLIDSTGASLGLLLVWTVTTRRNREKATELAPSALEGNSTL